MRNFFKTIVVLGVFVAVCGAADFARADVLIYRGNNVIYPVGGSAIQDAQFGTIGELKAWNYVLSQGLLKPFRSSDTVLIGDTSTTSPGSTLEVKGASVFRGTLTATSTVTFSAINGSTQCLQVNSSGVVTGTGSA